MHPTDSRTVRRWYFLSLLLALALLVVTRFVILPTTPDASKYRVTAGTVLDTLVASAVTSLVIGAAYVLLFPKKVDPDVQQIRSRDIEPTILQATTEAREWKVRARTASYFSKVTLQSLEKAALRSGRGINIRVQLLDPENPHVLASYARFRSNRPRAAARWTPGRVRFEIYGTLLRLAISRNEAPRLDIEVGLSPALWVVSLDISDQLAIITGQNRGEPALLFRKGSEFFDSYNDDFDAGYNECRRLVPVIPDLTDDVLNESLTQSHLSTIREFFSTLQLSVCSDDEIREIVRLMRREHNYA